LALDWIVTVEKSKTELEVALNHCRSAFSVVGAFSFFINILMLAPPLYMLQIYDRVLISRSEPTLIALTLIVVVMFVAMGLLEWVRGVLLAKAAAKLESLLGERVLTAMFASSLRSGASGASQPMTDLGQIGHFLSGPGLLAFFDAPLSPIYLFVLYLFHPLLCLIAILGAAVLFLLAIMNDRSTRRMVQEASAKSIDANNYLVGNLRNAEALHAMGMLDAMKARWRWRHNEIVDTQSAASEKGNGYRAASRALRLMLQSLILGAGAYLAIKNLSTPGTVIAGAIILSRALAPIDQIMVGWHGFVTALEAYRRLGTLLRENPTKPELMPLPAPKGLLELDNLFVQPPGIARTVVAGVTARLAPGEALAIIGPSAAGKSSLARAILGVWPPLSGKVRLDGADIAAWNRTDLGPHIGYLPQDIELFEGTVAENIARFGQVDPEWVVEAAKDAGAHDMILRFPQGYDTPIGKSGYILSGGHRQRVGLARALYRRPCLIVLDEPNSNLDDQGELALAKAIERLKARGATLLIITHRASVLKLVDQVLVLKEGRMHLYGSRDEMLAKLQVPLPVFHHGPPLPGAGY